MRWLLRERWTLHTSLHAADAVAKLASLTGPVEWAVFHAGFPFAGEVGERAFRLLRRDANGRPNRDLLMLGRIHGEEAGCSVDVEFRSAGRRSPASVLWTVGLLFAFVIANWASLRYVALVAGALYLLAVLGFSFAVRREKRVLAATLEPLHGDALEGVATGRGWTRDVVIASVALAALLLGMFVPR